MICFWDFKTEIEDIEVPEVRLQMVSAGRGVT